MHVIFSIRVFLHWPLTPELGSYRCTVGWGPCSGRRVRCCVPVVWSAAWLRLWVWAAWASLRVPAVNAPSADWWSWWRTDTRCTYTGVHLQHKHTPPYQTGKHKPALCKHSGLFYSFPQQLWLHPQMRVFCSQIHINMSGSECLWCLIIR